MSSEDGVSLHLKFFRVLERLQRIDTTVMADTLGSCASDFLHRGWIAQDGYLTRVMVPFRDSQQEVEVEIDVDAALYRYRSPQQRSRVLERPLAEITLYSLQVDTWLRDLASLIDIEARHLCQRPMRVRGHLWHLGELRIAGTHNFAPVFIVRSWQRAPQDEVRAVLGDAIWPRGGIVLRQGEGGLSVSLPRDHVMRGIGEFVRVEAGRDIFDASAFDRVLRGYATPSGTQEPVQFFQNNRLKLPHFETSRELSLERVRIIKQMWGAEGRAVPEVSWAEVNAVANTGYQSFDDAFDSKAKREDVIERVRRGKYRLRRNP
jgi:hypothetical protein